MIMAQLLKECPFCGGQAEAATDGYRERFINDLFGSVIEPSAKNAWIFCTVCGARGRTIHDSEYDGFKDQERENRMKEEAATAWNQRAGKGAAL